MKHDSDQTLVSEKNESATTVEHLRHLASEKIVGMAYALQCLECGMKIMQGVLLATHLGTFSKIVN